VAERNFGAASGVVEPETVLDTENEAGGLVLETEPLDLGKVSVDRDLGFLSSCGFCFLVSRQDRRQLISGSAKERRHVFCV